jgi:hypothetical protein
MSKTDKLIATLSRLLDLPFSLKSVHDEYAVQLSRADLDYILDTGMLPPESAIRLLNLASSSVAFYLKKQPETMTAFIVFFKPQVWVH